MNLISLDLELNQPSEKIVQVGYVVGDILTKEIHLERSFYITLDEVFSEFVAGLTGIRPEQLLPENGSISLESAYEQVKQDHAAYACFRNPITWGGGDSDHLRKQLSINDTDKYIFGRRWLDTKTLYISYAFTNGLKPQGGLAKCLTKFMVDGKRLQFRGKKHNALDDAKNTFILYCVLMDKLKVVT